MPSYILCTIPTATVQVKLVHGGASSYLGKVMHYFNSSWRTVCDKNWVTKMSNSDVLCRQLGLGHALDHWLHVSSGEDTHFLHMNIDCSGTEDKLRLCPHNFTISNTCDRMSVPWVVCSGEYSYIDPFSNAILYIGLHGFQLNSDPTSSLLAHLWTTQLQQGTLRLDGSISSENSKVIWMKSFVLERWLIYCEAYSLGDRSTLGTL